MIFNGDLRVESISEANRLPSIQIPACALCDNRYVVKVFTAQVFGRSCRRSKNINRELVIKLLMPAVLSGVIGVYILIPFPRDQLKPIIFIYLLIMAFVILIKEKRRNHQTQQITSFTAPLGKDGRFFDAISSAGMSPIVTNTLLVRKDDSHFIIGSADFGNFFVTFTELIAVLLTLSVFQYWCVILDLLN
jgi:uncharacterized membrane protein YfcA